MKDIAAIFQQILREEVIKDVLVSVTRVYVTADLAIAKVYVSIFPVVHTQFIIDFLAERTPFIKHTLAQKTKTQLRKTPDLVFAVDDSLEYADGIEKALKGNENPIENPELLPKRKLS